MSEEGDCELRPDDPIHVLKATSMMDGLGSTQALGEYNTLTWYQKTAAYFQQKADCLSTNIRPGSPAWNALTQPEEVPAPKQSILDKHNVKRHWE